MPSSSSKSQPRRLPPLPLPLLPPESVEASTAAEVATRLRLGAGRRGEGRGTAATRPEIERGEREKRERTRRG